MPNKPFETQEGIKFADGTLQTTATPTGPTGPGGVTAQATPPEDTTVIWLDTSTDAIEGIGPTGPTGSQGPTGPTGSTGPQGDTGPAGTTDYNNLLNKPTAVSAFTNDAGYATETYVDTAVSNLVASAPATLDTLNEIATALGNDPNLATTLSTQIGLKANSADVYTKTETYDKTEVDNALSLKADLLSTNIALGSKADSASLSLVATSGDYNDLSNLPTIPTAVSELTNDSGYLTSADLSSYATEAYVNSQDFQTSIQVDTSITSRLAQTDYQTSVDVANTLAGYYTKGEADTLLLTKADNSSLIGLATETYVDNAVASIISFDGNYSSLIGAPDYTTVGALAEPTLVLGAGTLSYTPTIETGIIAAGNHTGTYAGLTVQNQNTGVTSSANIYLSNAGATEVDNFVVFGLNGPNYDFGYDYIDGAKKLLYIANTDGDITLIPNYYNGGNIHLGYGQGASAISVTNNGGLSLGTTWNNAAQAYVLNQGTTGQVLTSGGNAAAVSWTTPFSGSYNDLADKPNLFSGSYTDLTDKPTLFDGAYSSLTGAPTFATHANLVVDPLGNDTTGTGTVAKPFATIQAAHDYAVANIQANQHVIIVVNSGYYSGNVTLTRPLTNVVGVNNGTSKSTRLDGTLTVDFNTPLFDVYTDTFTVENLMIGSTASSGNMITLAGSAPYSFIARNLNVYASTAGSQGLVVTNTAAAGIFVDMFDSTVQMAGSATTSLDLNNVFTAVLRECTVYGSAGPAAKITNSNLVASNTAFRSTSGAKIIDVVSGFGTQFNPVSAPTGSVAFIASNSSFQNLAANNDGVDITIGATALISQGTFSVVAGTGFAVKGVAGSLFINGVNLIFPGTNDKVSSAIGAGNIPMTTSFTAA